MTDTQAINSSEPLPLMDLFEAMRQALQPLGIALGIADYVTLQQALAKGHGGASWDGQTIVSWENLRRVTQLLWLKPIPSYDVALKVFDRTFEDYRSSHQDYFSGEAIEVKSSVIFNSTVTVEEIQWPTIPPRKGYERKTVETGQVKTLGAFQSKSLQDLEGQNYILSPQVLPLTLEQVQSHWRSLRQSVREGVKDELDLEATIAQMVDRGVLDDVVWRSRSRQRAELVVLVDDGAAMGPLTWAVEPLIRAVVERWVAPAQIYRFTSYPDQFLYGWARSREATAIAAVLSRWSRSRTVLLLVSDAGAAMGVVRPERIVGSLAFVERALPCVRQLLWLNPLPRERWVGNSAQAIAAGLAGRMLPLAEFEGRVLRSRERGGVLV